MKNQKKDEFIEYIRLHLSIEEEALLKAVAFCGFLTTDLAPNLDTFFKAHQKDWNLAIDLLKIGLGRVDVTGMQETLYAIERTRNYGRHYVFSVQPVGARWGIAVESFPRNGYQIKVGLKDRILFPLARPVFDTEASAQQFKDVLGFPLVFRQGILVGCIDDTSESFCFRPIIDFDFSMDEQEEVGILSEILEKAGYSVIHL